MPSSRDPEFPTTHWTLVQIVQGADKKQAAVALEDLCESYWYPIYAFLRRSGKSAHDAEDLTQMLFQKLVADEALQEVRKERGRLRSFLIGMVRRVISRQDRHDDALKRGGGETLLSLDETVADDRYANEPADLQDPERLYDRAWAMQLLESVRLKLRESFIKNKRLADYEVLEAYLGWDDSPAPHAELAIRLGSNEGAVRVLVHRLRKKFRDLLEAEISKTVVNAEDIAEELEWLRTAVGK
ncbi:RNA polymerase sigma factor [Prosthecobacter sp.]|uniref:RNA polymerase sigma factor n=1 Tax=Prosthecobacter sp. TaxID=1965333 RepID=UPI0037834DE5